MKKITCAKFGVKMFIWARDTAANVMYYCCFQFRLNIPTHARIISALRKRGVFKSGKMTSAEPGRKAPNSRDLRWRMVWQRIGINLSYSKIASNLNVALGTAHNINHLFRKTGDVVP